MSRSQRYACKCGCEACAEQIRYLEDEMRGQLETAQIQRIKRCLPVSSPQAARLALAMLAHGDRFVSRDNVDVVLPGSRDRDGYKIIDVAVCRLRKGFGGDAIETAWGKGWRLTPVGRARILAALNQTAEVAA